MGSTVKQGGEDEPEPLIGRNAAFTPLERTHLPERSH
jgi:hypothetical protein